MNDVAARRRKVLLGGAFGITLLLAALALVLQQRATDDPYMPGTQPTATLVRDAACPSTWWISLDDTHRWESQSPVPDSWTDDTVSGTIRIDDAWGEATFEANGEHVVMYGGELNGSRAFDAACRG